MYVATFLLVANLHEGNNFSWTSTEICNWLDKLQLSKCKSKLLAQGIIISRFTVDNTNITVILGNIDGRTLLAITEEDLIATYKIDSPLLRSRLLAEIYKLKLQHIRGIVATIMQRVSRKKI